MFLIKICTIYEISLSVFQEALMIIQNDAMESLAFNNSQIILFWSKFLRPYSFCGGGEEKGLSLLLIKMKILIN